MSIYERLAKAYRKALKDCRKGLKEFLQKYKAVMSGQIKPPQYYVDNDLVDYWRNGFINALMRQLHVQEVVKDTLAAAGGKASRLIHSQLYTEYGHGRLEQVKVITQGCQQFGLQPTFMRIDTQAIEVAVNDSIANSPFSKLKFANFGSNTKLRQKMQLEMAASIANGEGVRQLEKRISKVYGEGYTNARLCAQTESTRIRNEARYNTDMEAQQMGIETERIWHCRFQNTREGHAMMEGVPANEQGGWNVPWQSGKRGGVDFMRFPGDPNGSAANVCNCHCSVQTRVKSSSPALAALRQRNGERREAWLGQNAQSNDWRDRKFGGGQHPYARGRN